MKRALLLLALLALLAPAPGAGQFGLNNVTSRAIEGPFRAFTTYQDGITTFRYFVQLHHGSLFKDFINFEIDSALDYPWEGIDAEIAAGVGLIHTHGNVRVVGPRAYAPGMVFLGGYEPTDGIPVHPLSVETYETNFALYGCDIPEGDGLLYQNLPEYTAYLSYMQTCPEEGLDGWLEFRLPALGRYTLLDARADFVTFSEVQVTPEPGTMLLLGTGILGLSAGVWRRPKKQQR